MRNVIIVNAIRSSFDDLVNLAYPITSFNLGSLLFFFNIRVLFSHGRPCWFIKKIRLSFRLMELSRISTKLTSFTCHNSSVDLGSSSCSIIVGGVRFVWYFIGRNYFVTQFFMQSFFIAFIIVHWCRISRNLVIPNYWLAGVVNICWRLFLRNEERE